MIEKLTKSTLIFIFFTICYSVDCDEIGNKISQKYEKGDYEIAYSIAKKNYKDNKCSASFNLDLAEVFLLFNDYKLAKKTYNIALNSFFTIPDQKVTKDSVQFMFDRLIFYTSEINFIQKSFQADGEIRSAISRYKTLVDGNGLYDPREHFTDLNGDKEWNEGEDFIDFNFKEFGELYYRISILYKNNENHEESYNYITKALKINPYFKKYIQLNDVLSKLIAKKGNDFLRLNQLDEAIDQYNLALNIMSDNETENEAKSSIYFNLGYAYFGQNKFEDSIKAFNLALDLDSDRYRAAHKIGLCYQELNYHEEAVDNFKKAISISNKLDENYMSSYHSISISYMKMESYDQAINYLNKALQESPKFYKAYETLGVIYADATLSRYQNHDLALENFHEANRLKPKDYMIKFRLARLYNTMAEKDRNNNSYKKMEKNSIEAKKYARQCIKIKKTYGGAYYELGSAELNLCNKSAGLKTLKKAAKYDRKYRSEVKRIIKQIKPITNHCE